LLAGLIVFRTWFVGGFPVFCEVQGGSMAQTLLGRHFDERCSNCGISFFCDAQDFDAVTSACCPNCAAKVEFSPPPRVLAGDRVLIDRTAFQVRRPRRWEVIAFQRFEAVTQANDTQGLTVKRVVGLPGERIQITDGDIYANGQIQRKTLRQQRAMRILVHDDDHAGAAPRWRPQEAGSNWNRQSPGIAHAENSGKDIGWIVYNHATSAGPSDTAAAVNDFSFYNWGRLQRSETIHRMADLAMSFRIAEIHGRGLFWLRATDGRDEFMIEVQPGDGKFTVARNRKSLTEASGDLGGALRGQTMEVSLFDRQFLLAVAGRTLATVNIDGPVPNETSGQPLAIGVRGLGMVIDHLRVYRDVYYTDSPLGTPHGEMPAMLGANEYFVLGDNSPISEDSRTWRENRFVGHGSLVGRPFVVIDPTSEISLFGWHIQVPDLARIRYIR
jgi:signal peptidase I